MLICILFIRWHWRVFVISWWNTFWDLAGMGWVLSKHVDMQFLSRLAFYELCWDAFCVLTDLVWVFLTHVRLHFVSSLAWDGFGQHKMKYILCPHWNGRGLVNTSCDTFCVLAGMGWGLVNTCSDAFYVLAVLSWVLSTQVDMHFVCSLSWNGFGQNMLKCILCPSWHGMGFGQHVLRIMFCLGWNGRDLVNTWWDAFYVLTGEEGVWWDTFCPRCHGKGLVNTCWDVFCISSLAC